MGFQCRVITAILYVEMLLTVLLLFPVIPPKWWCKLLESFLFQWVVENIQIFFWSAVFTLTVIFGDAAWRHRKCRSLLPAKLVNAQQVTILSTWAEMFRAQRNLFISGFVLLLAFVNKRLVALLIYTANETQEQRYTHRRNLH